MASQYRIERDRGTQESRQQFAVLREKWPLAFPVKDQDVRPLAIGATGEIAAAMGWSLPYTLGVLGRWKMAPVYCQAVLCHDQRVALDGSPAETVDAEAKDLAAKQLARLAARQVAKNTANAAVTQKPASAPPPAPPPETPKQLRGLVRASLLRQRVVRGKQMTSEGCGDNQKGEAPLAKWQDKATTHCDPLYIQDFFFKHGHEASTRNATATFVQFEGRYFACTCRHAVELVKKRREANVMPFATLMLGFDKTFIPLSFFTAEGLQDSILIVPPRDESEHYMDLAIADVTTLWPRISEEAKKQAIDMDADKWREPRWARAEMLAAAGYPEMGKRNAIVNGKDRVIGTSALILAEKSGDVARDQRIVLMRIRLAKPHGWFFSGISGGPMYVVQDDLLIPLGITFEGWPQTKDDKPHSGLTELDIMVRGLTLTPDNFKRWLLTARL